MLQLLSDEYVVQRIRIAKYGEAGAAQQTLTECQPLLQSWLVKRAPADAKRVWEQVNSDCTAAYCVLLWVAGHANGRACLLMLVLCMCCRTNPS